MCDWDGCESRLTSPAVVRLHEHDDAQPHEAALDEHRFDLCPEHTGLLVQFVQFSPLHEEA